MYIQCRRRCHNRRLKEMKNDFSVMRCSGFWAMFSKYWTFSSTKHSNRLLTLSRWKNNYQLILVSQLSITSNTLSCMFHYWSSNRMINQIMYFNEQRLTCIYHLNQMVLHCLCPLFFFCVRFRIHTNNGAHQPYMIHQSTFKMLNNAIKINYQTTRAI